MLKYFLYEQTMVCPNNFLVQLEGALREERQWFPARWMYSNSDCLMKINLRRAAGCFLRGWVILLSLGDKIKSSWKQEWLRIHCYPQKSLLLLTFSHFISSISFHSLQPQALWSSLFSFTLTCSIRGVYLRCGELWGFKSFGKMGIKELMSQKKNNHIIYKESWLEVLSDLSYGPQL